MSANGTMKRSTDTSAQLNFAAAAVALGGILGFAGVYLNWFKYSYPVSGGSIIVYLDGQRRLDRAGGVHRRHRGVRVRGLLRVASRIRRSASSPASSWGWPPCCCWGPASPPSSGWTVRRPRRCCWASRQAPPFRWRPASPAGCWSRRSAGSSRWSARRCRSGRRRLRHARRALTHDHAAAVPAPLGSARAGADTHLVGAARPRGPRGPAHGRRTRRRGGRAHPRHAVYVYDLVRVREQAWALRDAFAAAGLRGIVRLALKAQREPELLAFLRSEAPGVGMDVCSPGEVDWALANGWTPGEISYTGTNVSERDLDRILAAGVHVNVDLLSQLERYGRRAPGTSVGVRVNPGIGATAKGGGESLYTGAKPTKFGILPERLDEALAIAARHRLAIDTVHVHVGDGYLTDGLPVFAETVRRVAGTVRHLREAGHPDRGGQHGRWSRGAGRAGRRTAGRRSVGRGPRGRARAARRRRRHRAGRLPREGVRRAPRRGRDGGGPRGRSVRRARYRLERDGRALRIRVEPAAGAVPRRRCRRRRAPSPSPATSTRATTCSARTCRCPRSARATSSPR